MVVANRTHVQMLGHFCFTVTSNVLQYAKFYNILFAVCKTLQHGNCWPLQTVRNVKMKWYCILYAESILIFMYFNWQNDNDIANSI